MIARLRTALVVALSLALPATARAASAPAVEAAHGMVVSSQALASQIGADILAAGGNAVDAAVAVAFAEAVVNPCCGNLGGGGFLLLHMGDGRSRFVNFREKAPGAASQDMYLDPAGKVVKGASLRGWKAAGVPGTVLGLTTALARYGTMPLARIVAPAVALARDVFVLTRADTDILETGTATFARDPAVARIFLRPDGSPFRPWDRLVQADLARTLQAIADGGTVFKLVHVHGFQVSLERVAVGSHGQACKGFAGEQYQADFIVWTRVDKLLCNLFGAFQSVRSQVLGEHRC